MLYQRVIPVLLFDDGGIWRSQEFRRHYRMGDPLTQMERYKGWDLDEIIYVDMHRRENGRRLIEFLPEIARNCFAPLATGGGIRTMEDIRSHLDAGADRVVINTVALDNPAFITESSRRYGAQAVIVSIDARKTNMGHEVFVDGGSRATGRSPQEWAAEAAERGAGEIFLNSIDRDGMGGGYDIPLIRSVADRISVPLIACGGAGSFSNMAAALDEGAADAVAAANILTFHELSYFSAKDALTAAGVRVRASVTLEKRRRYRR